MAAVEFIGYQFHQLKKHHKYTYVDVLPIGSISVDIQQPGNNWAGIEGTTPQTKIVKMVNLSLVDKGVI